jgi:hypothetical protein
MFDPHRDRNLQSSRFSGVICQWYLCRLLLLACLPNIASAQTTAQLEDRFSAAQR